MDVKLIKYFVYISHFLLIIIILKSVFKYEIVTNKNAGLVKKHYSLCHKSDLRVRKIISRSAYLLYIFDSE